MTTEDRCPDEDVFVAFIGGELEAGEREGLERHLDACPTCAELLAQLARSPLVSARSDADTVDADAPPLLPRRLLAGESVGRYVIERELGAGGMGVVYVARDPELDRQVAIKLLRPRLAEGAAGQERLLAEARTLAALSHDNVVQVFDVGTHADQVYVAMELVVGANLRQWRTQAKPDWRDALRVCTAAGEGLAAVHRAGINHRDVKPSNVLVADDGRVVLIDFGLAGAQSRTPSHDLVGTPGYIAPEQLEGEPPDPRGDQYAFCVLLHETLFGARPFDEDGERVNVERGRVPASVVAAIDRGLYPRPDERFPDMPALLAALRIRRRATPVVVSAAVLGTAAAALLWLQPEDECGAAEDHVAAMWAGRRSQAAEAFARTELSFADATWRHTSDNVDAWTEGWTAAYADACETGGEQLDARMACLHRARRRVGAVIGMFADADRDAVIEASKLSLPDVDACRDAAVTPPDPQVEQAYDRIAAAEAEFARGRFDAALSRAQEVHATAAALRDAELAAAAALSLGRAEGKTGAYDDAERHLLEASAGEGRTAVRALLELVWLDGYERLAFDDARRHARHANAGLQRLGDDPELRADLDYRTGWIEIKAGDAALARTHFEAAARGHTEAMDLAADHSAVGVALLQLADLDGAKSAMTRSRELAESALGPEHPDLIPIFSNIGVAQLTEGNVAEAEKTYRRLIGIATEAFGEEHALPGRLRINLGTVLSERGRFAAAQREFEVAGKVLESALGPEHPELARALNGLAEALHAQERLDEAIQLYERGLAIKVAALGDEHPGNAVSLTNIGLLRIRSGRPEDALPPLERSAKLIEQAYGETEQLVTVLSGLGEALKDLGRLEDSARAYERCIEIGTRVAAADLGSCLRGRAEVHLVAGTPAQAEPLLRRAIELWRSLEGTDPAFEGYAHFALARTLWALDRNDEARAEARAALQLLAAADPDYHADVVAWLAAR